MVGEGPGRVAVNAIDGISRLTPDAVGTVAGDSLSAAGSGSGDLNYFKSEVSSFARNALKIVEGIEATGQSLEFVIPAAVEGGRERIVTPSYDLDWIRQVWMLSPEEWASLSGSLHQSAALLETQHLIDEAEDFVIAIEWLDSFF